VIDTQNYNVPIEVDPSDTKTLKLIYKIVGGKGKYKLVGGCRVKQYPGDDIKLKDADVSDSDYLSNHDSSVVEVEPDQVDSLDDELSLFESEPVIELPLSRPISISLEQVREASVQKYYVD